jgi:hypothetical protein
MKIEDFTVNGVRIGGAETKDEQETRTVELPSGKCAEVRKGVGRDLMRAQRAAAGGDASAVIFALIAELTRVDGRKIVYEEVLEMELADVMAFAGRGDWRKFRPPSAASFASLVQSGISVQELNEMDFAELSYWLDAMTECERARVEGGGGEDHE